MQKNGIAKRENTATFSMKMSSDKFQHKIHEVLQDKNRAIKFTAALTSAVANQPALQECEATTILSSALLGESLNLSPSPQLGQYYIVPYKDRNNGRIVGTFQLGYKGYIQLALRSGNYKKLNVLEIKEGELISWNPLTEEIDATITARIITVLRSSLKSRAAAAGAIINAVTKTTPTESKAPTQVMLTTVISP